MNLNAVASARTELRVLRAKMSKRASNTGFGSSKQSKGGSVNPKAALKLEHLQRLALWTGGEASVPSLGAFFGQRLASTQEALDVPPDPSMVSCQRCETILQPGFNCTIRIEKNRAKARRRSKKPANFTFTQNNVVYTCHFCSERNVKRGTARGHMKAICPPKIKKASYSRPAKSSSQKFVTPKKNTSVEDKVCRLQTVTPTVDEEMPAADKFITSTTIDKDTPTVDSPTTPIVKPVATLLDSKRKKKKKSASKIRPEPEEDNPVPAENSASTTNKRRRKSWTSLKELADRNQQQKNIGDLSIPFFM